MNKQLLKTLTTAVISLMTLAVHAQNSFSITGKLTSVYEGKKVILQYLINGQEAMDSALVKNGSFHFIGKVNMPQKATLTMPPMPARDEQKFFLENTTFSVDGSTIKTAIIKGGQAQTDFIKLRSMLKPLEEKMKPLSARMQQYFTEQNKAAQDSLFPSLRAIRLDMDRQEEEFITQNPDSYVSLSLLQERSIIMNVKKFEPLFNSLSPQMHHTETGKLLASRLAVAKKTDIGQPAIDFVQKNTDGIPISLSSLRGKYVLLDFWASWCGPCRAENPNVVKAYHQYKDKNFEIIAVSLDSEKAPWIKAIADDHLPWIHVSDLKGWKNAVAVEYGVQAVPQNYLLGPDGTILAKNIRGEELHKKLAELLTGK